MLHVLDWDDDESVTIPQGQIVARGGGFAPTITILGMPAVQDEGGGPERPRSEVAGGGEPALDWDDEAEITVAQEQAPPVRLPEPKLPPRRGRRSTISPPPTGRSGCAAEAPRPVVAADGAGAVVVAPIIDVIDPQTAADGSPATLVDDVADVANDGYDTIVDECVPDGLRHASDRASSDQGSTSLPVDFAAALGLGHEPVAEPTCPAPSTRRLGDRALDEPAPATSPSARDVDVDLAELGGGAPSWPSAQLLLAEALDDETAMTPLPRGIRPGELRGSVPPVALSDPPSPPAQQSRVGLLAVAGAAAACLAIFALLLYPRTGSLTVRLRTADGSSASKAEIYVDGKKRCDTDPCMVGDLGPGTKTIKVIVPGLEHPRVAHIDVMSGEQQLLWVDLPSRQGIKAYSRQDDVRVSVDGIDRGVLPVEIADLTAGEHRVRFSAAGATPLERTVRVDSNQLVDLGSIELSKATPQLTVRRVTAGARVVLIAPDGDHHVLRGPWPKQLALEPGAYRLVASCPGHQPFSSHFELGASRLTHEMAVELERAGTGAAPPVPVDQSGQTATVVQAGADELDPYED